MPDGIHVTPRRPIRSSKWPEFDQLAKRAGLTPSALVTRLVAEIVYDCAHATDRATETLRLLKKTSRKV